MVEVPIVTPGSDVGETQPAGSAAPAVIPPVHPTETVKANETVGGALNGIDGLGAAPAGPPTAAPAGTAPYGGQIPPPERYEAPPAYPADPGEPAPGELINEFVKRPKQFIREIAKEMAAEQVAPFIEALREFVQVSHRDRVVGAVQGSRDRLRDYAKQDTSLTDKEVAREVNTTYSYFIRNAANGNQEAIAALNNPMTPFLVTQAAKLKTGRMAGSAPAGTPVTYRGGTLEGRGTVGPRPLANIDETTAEWDQKWGLSTEQVVKNEEEALKYLNQK